MPTPAPFLAAVTTGDTATVGAMLEVEPALANATSEEGEPVLHAAIWHRQREVTELLLAHGADPNRKSGENRTALHVAFECSGPDYYHLLVDHGAEVDACVAAGLGLRDRLDALLEEDPARADEISTGLAPLHWAAYGDQGESVTRLLVRGADVEGRRRETGCAPLHCAAQANHTTAAHALLGGGADPDARDAGGGTPLHHAAAMPFTDDGTDVARVLLAAGADVNARNRRGLTPLGLLRAAAAAPDGDHPCSPPQSVKNAAGMGALLREHGATE